MKLKSKKRAGILSIVLALAMVFNLGAISGLAADNAEGPESRNKAKATKKIAGELDESLITADAIDSLLNDSEDVKEVKTEKKEEVKPQEKEADVEKPAVEEEKKAEEETESQKPVVEPEEEKAEETAAETSEEVEEEAEETTEEEAETEEVEEETAETSEEVEEEKATEETKEEAPAKAETKAAAKTVSDEENVASVDNDDSSEGFKSMNELFPNAVTAEAMTGVIKSALVNQGLDPDDVEFIDADTPIPMLFVEALVLVQINDAGLTDLSGFEIMSRMTALDLSGNSISNLSPLAGMKNLLLLALEVNNISDINVVANFTELEVLALDYNSISDISPIKGLTNLQLLELGSNNISNISALSGLANLDELYLYMNNISDISALKGLVNLEVLDLGANKISNITALSGLSNLIEGYVDFQEVDLPKQVISGDSLKLTNPFISVDGSYVPKDFLSSAHKGTQYIFETNEIFYQNITSDSDLTLGFGYDTSSDSPYLVRIGKTSVEFSGVANVAFEINSQTGQTTQQPPASAKKSNIPVTKNPQTGDNSTATAQILALLASAVVIAYAFSKKKALFQA